MGEVLTALQIFGAVDIIVALLVGILVGTLIGFLPGLGLLVAFALALPFVVGMEPVVALAFLLAMYAQATIAGDLTAIAFAVPGTPASAALVVDGHEMAKRGEVGQAVGAALTSSALGAVIGIVPLLFLVPLARPLVLAMGSPEIFALTVLGVSMVAAVSGQSLLKGLTAGGIGFLLAAFGPETQFGIIRYGFSHHYLLDGIPLLPIAIGMFAIPEMLDLHSRRTSIVRTGELRARWSDIRAGAQATFQNIVLVVRSSLIGLAVGFIPGLGATVGQWIAYGNAVTFSKEPKRFGEGDIRGVIAPGSANNSKDGGELLPTIAFGVPGSPPMALLLAALILLGIAPGPNLLGINIHLTYFMLFTLVVTNLVGVGLSAFVGRYLGRALGLKGAYMVPVIITFLVVGAGANSGRIGDIVVLLGAGGLAWLMRLYGWPLVPLILGFVLGDRSEQMLWRTVAAYGADWLRRPGVLVLLAITLALALAPTLLQRRSRNRSAAPSALMELGSRRQGRSSSGSIALGLGILGLGAFMVTVPILSGWPTPAIVFPISFGIATGVLALLVVLRDVTRLRGGDRDRPSATPATERAPAAVHAQADEEQGSLARAPLAAPAARESAAVDDEATVSGRRRVMMLALLLLGVAIWVLGTSLALALFIGLYLRLEARVPRLSAAIVAVGSFVVTYWGMAGALAVRLPGGILTGLGA